MLTPTHQSPHSPSSAESPVRPNPALRPPATIQTHPLILPRPFPNNLGDVDSSLSTMRSSLMERGISAACKEYPGALPHLIRFLPVSFSFKQRVAECVLSDLPLEKALQILHRLGFPHDIETDISLRLATKSISTVSSVESFWKAVEIKRASPLTPEQRLALALRCVGVDPVGTSERLAQFELTTPELQVPFARACIERSGIDTIFDIPWLTSLGSSDPGGAREIAELCISHNPFDTASRLDRFGLPLHPLIDRVMLEVGARHRWKVLARVCSLPGLADDVRTALVEASFKRYPHETLKQLDIFKLPEGQTATRILSEGLSVHPKAVEAYIQKHGSPFFREIAEHVLWTSLSHMPWEAAEIATRVGLTNQSLLSAIAQETFQRDPRRSLRFIRQSKAFTAETLAMLALQFSAIDAVSVSRCIKDFGALPNTTVKTIAHRVASVDPERALQYLSTPLFKSDENKRDLLLSMAATAEGAALAANNLYACALADVSTKMRILRECSTRAPDAVIDSLRFAALPERMHAELVAQITSGHEGESRALLHRVGVYSRDALHGLFTPRFIDSYDAVSARKSIDVARWKAKLTPAKVATNIAAYRLADEQQRVEIAVACAKRAPRAVADNFIQFGIYTDEGRKAVAAALCRSSAESLREAVKTCGVTSPEDIQDLVVPFVANRPRLLLSLEHLSREPWPPRFFIRLFAQAIKEHRWNNALEISKIAVATTHGREPRMSETLRSFDNLLTEMGKLSSLNEDTRYNLMLVERARRAGIVPQSAVLNAFTIFDESTDSFIVEILQQGGPTAGANIVEEVTRIYRKKRTIPEGDRTVIREFISSGFSGFSKATLVEVKKAFAKSPEHGRELLASWRNISTNILRGTSLATIPEDSAFLANLVYAAYRPVDLTVADVRAALPTIPDNSHHLTPWRYPSAGYQVQLVELDEVRVKPEHTLDLEGLRKTASPILGVLSPESSCSHEEFVQMLVKASQRGTDSINRGKLVGFLAAHSRDIRVQGAIRELAPLSGDTVSAQQAAEAIERMKSFYTVVYGDMLEGTLREYFDNGRLELREQFKNRIRSIRKLAPDAELTIDQIRETVREQLDKVWRNERTLLNRESRKFAHQLGSMHGSYKLYLSKSPPAFFGRAGAGLCTHDDLWSWNEKSFLQMIMVDEHKGRVVGNIQLHIFHSPKGKPAVLARLNPTEKFLLTVSKRTLVTEMLACVEAFARDNNLEAYLPGDGDHLHLLTNRESFAPFLKARYGEHYEQDIQVSSWLHVKEIYSLREAGNESLQAPSV